MKSLLRDEKDNIAEISCSKCKQKLSLSDNALLLLFVEGNSEAFDCIVVRYKQRIFEFINFQLKKNNSEAEDLTQEVFIQLYNNADNFRQESKFSSYLFSIAKNTVFNYFRSCNRMLPRSQKFEDIENNDEQCLQLSLITETRQQKLEHALSRLSFDNRQIIYLCDKEGFTYSQISQILNIKVGTVRSRHSAVRRKMI